VRPVSSGERDRKLVSRFITLVRDVVAEVAADDDVLISDRAGQT
jgi:hypothetical protein